MPHLVGFIHLVCRHIRSRLSVFIKQPTPTIQQEGFFEGESIIEIIWSGLSNLREAGRSAQRRLDADTAPVHHLRGQLPAITSKGVLWLQPVKQRVSKPLTGFASKPKRQ
ncbi:hypothetical protein BKA60DRAFT_466938 [Fusarium oxysporum]|nr:hypothetical protein BKA60DRAFT_466938 [Fusarium oxysporum]